MDNKKKGMLLSLLGIISLIVITTGVTYAFFNYGREGTKENALTSGSVTFIYEEVEANGAGISITNAFPVSDNVGKAQSGSGKVFNFTVSSKTGEKNEIPYTVTARMKSDSDLSQEAVRVYLTEVDGNTETQLLLDNYDNLTQTSITVPEGTVEKVIYTDTVEGNTKYEKEFGLRMWIDESIEYSPVKDENGNDVYPYNGKTFTLTVNVYADAEVVNVPETNKYTAYSIGEAITLSDGSKWHVLEASDENTSTVTLLSDYNLNSDGSYNTECGRDIDGNYKCSTMAFDSDNTQDYDELDENNVGYFIKNTYEPLVIKSLPGTINVTLPTANQIAKADSQTFEQTIVTLTNSWLLTTSYWTKTINTANSSSVWRIGSDDSYIGSCYTDYPDYFGIRPVITTLKSNIVDTMDSNTTLSIGDSVTAVDGSKWHVLETSSAGTKTVTLLSDYNLNDDGSYNTECGRDINNVYKCNTMAYDPDSTHDYDESDSNNIGYFIKNTYEPLVIKSLLETTNVTLPKAEQIPEVGSQTFSHTIINLSDPWILTTNYWTKTTDTIDDNLVYNVRGDILNFGYNDASRSDYFGARPVITTLKSNLVSE